jgi:DNA-binding response OmpR family regulator
VNIVIHRFTLLIADRNPHVREFLRREFISAGYRVQVAKDGREVLRMADADEPPQLLILDLDMPYVTGVAILEELQNRRSPLPVLVHTFFTEQARHPAVQKAAGFWEKRGNNIDGFKAAVAQILREFYPHRFPSVPDTAEKRREVEESRKAGGYKQESNALSTGNNQSAK